MDYTATEPPTTAARQRPHFFTLPAGFDPERSLPPALRSHGDEARYVVDTIGRKMVSRNVDERGFAHLHSAVLSRVLRPRAQASVIRALKEGGVIETSPHRADRFSRGYRLADGMLAQNASRRACRDLRLLGRIQSEHARMADEERARRLPIHDKLAHIQRCVSVSGAADGILTSLEPAARFCQSVLIENIRRRDFRFHVSQYGRCFNAVTGIKRELRQAIRIDGEPMGSVDLRCAQPALLALLIGLANPTSGLFNAQTYKACDAVPSLLPARLPAVPVDEFGRFRRLVCDGLFNEWLVEAMGWGRDAVKRAFLRDVLARRGDYPPTDLERGFQVTFPAVYAFIRAANKRDYRTLIRALQQAEAWLVIETVAPKLVERIPFVTLHDAIFCRQSDVPIVEGAFRATFDEIGFSMALKAESWGPEPRTPFPK